MREPAMSVPYAELHCLSNFSFQRGASSARELFERAHALGYAALAITDECTLSGIVRALEASEATGLKLIVGSELQLADGPRIVLLVRDTAGYTRLCELITRARRRADKGGYQLSRADLAGDNRGLIALWLPGNALQGPMAAGLPAQAQWLKSCFEGAVWLAVHLHRGRNDAARLAAQLALAQACGLPAVACGDVQMHQRRRRALHDCLTAIRAHCSLAEAGLLLQANGERHLRQRAVLARTFPEELLRETIIINDLCNFSPRNLKYEYPHEVVPAGSDARSHLARWPQGVPDKVRAQLQYELELISELHYESYFLTVHDIVAGRAPGHPVPGPRLGGQFGGVLRARHHRGRSGPGEPAVRALHLPRTQRTAGHRRGFRARAARRSHPVHLPKYGRERAALAATVISYRPRARCATWQGARPGRRPGRPARQLAGWWDGESPSRQRLAKPASIPDNPLIRRCCSWCAKCWAFRATSRSTWAAS
jgi:error-prone DNA polymerase